MIQPISDKIEAIQKAPRPKTKKQTRSLIGLIGYYRKYVPNFSAIAAPLTDLTKKGKPNIVVWGQEQENAFLALKQVLLKPPVLHLPDFFKNLHY